MLRIGVLFEQTLFIIRFARARRQLDEKFLAMAHILQLFELDIQFFTFVFFQWYHLQSCKKINVIDYEHGHGGKGASPHVGVQGHGHGQGFNLGRFPSIH